MPDELPPQPPGSPGQPPQRPRRPISAKDAIRNIQGGQKRQFEIDREARKRETETRRKKQLREILRIARTDIEKLVAHDAADKDYDDPWTYLREVAEHGCSSGIVSDLIYYTDTVKFYQAHKEEIWEQLNEDAESAGESVLNYMAQMPWGEDVADPNVFENNLAWFGYEAACQRLMDRHENPDTDDEGENIEPNLDIDV